MINDVWCASVYAPARRDLYLELPPEDIKGDRSMLGKLRLSLYGTRDAANNGQETLSEHFMSIGYVRGAGFPCFFYHPERNIWTMVRSDDYASAGGRSDLEWLEQQLKSVYDIKSTPCWSV